MVSRPDREEQEVFLLGADRLGRDLFSRVSLRRAHLALDRLVGVFMSLILGIVLGGISGYYGGVIDTGHPARHRVHPLDPDHPALDGAERGAAA